MQQVSSEWGQDSYSQPTVQRLGRTVKTDQWYFRVCYGISFRMQMLHMCDTTDYRLLWVSEKEVGLSHLHTKIE